MKSPGHRTRRRNLLQLAGIACLVIAALFLAEQVEARAGGGQSYGGSGRSSGGGYRSSGGGGYGGGGGGGDVGDLVVLVFNLIRILLDYPVVGVPVLIIIFVAIVNIQRQGGWPGAGSPMDLHHLPDERHGPTGALNRSGGPRPVRPPALTEGQRRQRAVQDGIARLKELDPNFSLPAFVDFVGLLYTRAVVARGSGKADTILPYLAQDVLADWQRRAAAAGGTWDVDEIVVGSVTILDIGPQGSSGVRCILEIEASMRELPGRGAPPQPVWLRERWTFRRPADVLSKPPEELRKLGCPSCGAPCELRPDGTCTFCDQVVTNGRFGWRLAATTVLERNPRPSVDELAQASVHPPLPTVYQPDLDAARRAFTGRHPGFSWPAFTERVGTVFQAIQQAWTSGDWDQARAFESDSLYSTHRYWMERYRAQGLRNVLENIRIDRIEPVKVQLDAFYESITVRIFAQMVDYTVDRAGNVVSGSPRQSRPFNEYWTFIAAVGADLAKPLAEKSCPSCGAPLQLSETGVCSHCGAVVSSGKFGWVLSRIDQEESYAG